MGERRKVWMKLFSEGQPFIHNDHMYIFLDYKMGEVKAIMLSEEKSVILHCVKAIPVKITSVKYDVIEFNKVDWGKHE